MQQKLSSLSFAALASLFCLSCGGNGPLVDVCISDPDHGRAVCVDTHQNPYFLSYAQTKHYVMFSPDDAQKILEAAGLTGHQKAQVMAHLSRVDALADNP